MATFFVVYTYRNWRKKQHKLFEECNLHRKSTVYNYSVASWVAEKRECDEDLECSISESSYDSEEESEGDEEAGKATVNNTKCAFDTKKKLMAPPTLEIPAPYVTKE